MAAAEGGRHDQGMALRKAEESAARRCEAARWLRQMEAAAAAESLPERPSEEEFCVALRNGLVLCNVLNRVNPGAVPKVVENPVVAVQSSDVAAQSAIQYFENMRNFLVAVSEMNLLTFEASDIEKGGSSMKVVDCILCLKAYHEWKLSGGIGIWRYGGIVKIASSSKRLPAYSSRGGGSADLNQQMLEFVHLLSEVSLEESRVGESQHSLFQQFVLRVVRAFLQEWGEAEGLPLDDMVLETILEQACKEFTILLASHRNQVRSLLRKMMKDENGTHSKHELIEAISKSMKENSECFLTSLRLPCGRRKQLDDGGGLEHQQEELEKLKVSFNEMKLQVESTRSQWEEDLRRLESYFEAHNHNAYHKLLEENRKLYNQVQDLKGSIRVYCRVKPFLKTQTDQRSTVDHIGENGEIMIVNPQKQGKEGRKMFSFNKIFGPNASQSEVFADTQPLIRSVMDGYNVCIFAYGQTGSGKTYTMSGPDITTEETWGVNYRSLNDLFAISQNRADTTTYDVKVQMIEIYNEQDVLDLMRVGHRNRAVGSTALNERSSRSHSVLTVHVQGKEIASGSTLRGCLHLVDLAGSERVDKSEAAGERLNEAKHINKSLSALGDVIAALAQKSSHVPYRNSKLTQVLQDALGGQAKTLMFVHMNPEADAFGETMSTLKFAERVATVELGAAHANKEVGQVKDLKEEISKLKLALDDKEREASKLRDIANRVASEKRNARTRSPLTATLSSKPEAGQDSSVDTCTSEIRSSSSGKQRRFRSPLSVRELDEKSPVINRELYLSAKFKTPSPPVRSSLSAERVGIAKSVERSENIDCTPVSRIEVPPKVQHSSSRKTPSSVLTAQSLRKFRDSEENRSAKPSVRESMTKTRLDSATKPSQKEEQTTNKNAGARVRSEAKIPRNISDIENEFANSEPTFHSNRKAWKLPPQSTRQSQSIDLRASVREMEPLTEGKPRRSKAPHALHLPPINLSSLAKVPTSLRAQIRAMEEAAAPERKRPRDGDVGPSTAAAAAAAAAPPPSTASAAAAAVASGEAQYVYLPIADALKAPGARVCLFAAVSEIGAAVRSRGTDFTLTLRIVDHSRASAISVTFFADNTALLPCVRSSGDVISLHNVVITMHHGEFFVTYNKRFSSFALFEGKVSTGCIPYQHSMKYHGSKHDNEFLTQLRMWLVYNPPGLKDLELQLRSIKSDSTFDLVCKVLDVHEASNGVWILYVWDGTDTPVTEFPTLDNESVSPPPLHLEGAPLPREVLCTLPCVGSVLRVFSNRFFKEILHLQKGIYWARFCNMTCKQEFGMWKGILLPSSRVRLLSNEDGSVADRLKLFDSRIATQIHRQPMASLPNASDIADVEYERTGYTTLMESLTHGEAKFFGGFLTAEAVIRKLNKLLGIPEDTEEGAPSNRNPPWIWCCLKSYRLDKNDPWGSRRYRIFGTEIRD
uniref:Kinesin motor domain-containing protein n=1 Tax=Oryza meridionalis TaxID=40149 RepID=A0A0E0DF43_9ORYZ